MGRTVRAVRISAVLFLLLLIGCPGHRAFAASKPLKLNQTKITLYTKEEGKDRFRLKVKSKKKRKKTDYTWTSSDPEVATVSAKGLIRAVKKGTAVITVSYGKRSAACTVKVLKKMKRVTRIKWNSSWKYASYSKIHSDGVKLYRAKKPKNIVVAVNAGHGTSGGDYVYTLCHPDGTPKVTGGSTDAGSVYATAVSSGMEFPDGTPEAAANLSLAKLLKTELLNAGYDVLMIREEADVQLDNIARSVFANQNADCHIALHYDSTSYDKGAYFTSVPDISSYRAMEPVASTWKKSNQFGRCVISGMRAQGVKIDGEGEFPFDLTQTSYSCVPSIDLEVGDKGSSRSVYTQTTIAKGIVRGVGKYFGK